MRNFAPTVRRREDHNFHPRIVVKMGPPPAVSHTDTLFGMVRKGFLLSHSFHMVGPTGARLPPKVLVELRALLEIDAPHPILPKTYIASTLRDNI